MNMKMFCITHKRQGAPVSCTARTERNSFPCFLLEVHHEIIVCLPKASSDIRSSTLLS